MHQNSIGNSNVAAAASFATIGSAPALTFATSVQSTPSGSTATATGVSIGSAFSTRLVIVMWRRNFNQTMTSATIGGVACSGATGGMVDHQDTTGNGGDQGVFWALVPTGTTATIVLTNSGTFFSTPHFTVYTVDSAFLSSTTPVTSFTMGGGPNTGLTATVNVLAGGFVLVGYEDNAGSGGNPGVTSSPTLTADTNIFDSSSGISLSAQSMSAATPFSAAFTYTTSSKITVQMAAWR